MRLLLGVLLLGCLGCQQKSSPAAHTPPASKASQMMEGFDLTDTQNGIRSMTLHAVEAQLFEDAHMAELDKPDATFFKLGKPSSRLVAPKGRVDTESHHVETWGGVTVTTVDSETLTTDRLQYDPAHNKIYTDLPVRLERSDSITNGIGLESDPELQQITIGKQTVIFKK
jgi:LPS export ABC transporter protein LptC